MQHVFFLLKKWNMYFSFFTLLVLNLFLVLQNKIITPFDPHKVFQMFCWPLFSVRKGDMHRHCKLVLHLRPIKMKNSVVI